MAKLYFRYGTMNCGKSTALIQAAHNYEERGMRVLVLKPAVDTKGEQAVVSRLGIARDVDLLIHPDNSLTELLADTQVHCVLIDEAQFLSPSQAEELFWFAATKDIPVLAYGLRTDFQTHGFPGSTRLLELAHELQELKSICRCGRKAVLNGRKLRGEFVTEGAQIAIEDQDDIEYEALCAIDYRRLVLGQASGTNA
jgi:thymidine kinase